MIDFVDWKAARRAFEEYHGRDRPRGASVDGAEVRFPQKLRDLASGQESTEQRD